MSREQTQMQKLEAQVGTLMRANIEKDGIIQGLMFALDKPKHEMERNPEAVCGNCAYFDHQLEGGFCRKTAMSFATEHEKLRSSAWCGEHPDFWRVRKCTDAEQIAEATDGARR